jgi:uncharacterized protein YgiM (DUF1202 family)
MKRRLPVVVAIGLLLLAFSSLATAKVYVGWVIPEVLNVRSGPGEDRDVMGVVRQGQKLSVTAFVDGWCYAKLPDGRRGYVMERHLQFSAEEGRKLEAAAAGSSSASAASGDTASGDGHPAWVKVEEAQVRSGPGTSYSSYGTREQGTKVYVVGRKGSWAKVKTPGGYGWIRADLLTDHVPTGQQLAASAASEAPNSDVHPAWIKVDAARVRSGPGDNTRSTAPARLARRCSWSAERVSGRRSGRRAASAGFTPIC